MAGRGRPPKNASVITEQTTEPQESPAVFVSGAAEVPAPAISEPLKDPLPVAGVIPTISQEETSNMSEEKISGTVTIGCKLPCGLVMTYKGKSVELKGSRESRILNGYGLTHNVDAEFWEGWKKAHAKLPFVKGELVFAYGDQRSAEDMAAERQNERTGLEGLDPNKPGKDLEKVPEDNEED